nr:MAG TPA_asm: hypothetical protein [Caudoviricetes sp.]DAZ30599.1 MAG TPA: hypothetical protein [Caudoviricetes sp.]
MFLSSRKDWESVRLLFLLLLQVFQHFFDF